MSIKDRSDNAKVSVTSGDRALQLFTDRHEFTCLFAEYLNIDPVPEKIIFFHGVGGNGKTLLLKHLQQRCCKRFPDYIWQQIQQAKIRSDEEAANLIVEHIEQDLKRPAPVAIIHDFGMTPIDNERPRDLLYGLLMLRRKISQAAKKVDQGNPRYQFKFPLFDFALFCYFQSIGKSPEEIKRSFPADEVGFVASLIDTFSDLSGVGLATRALKIIATHLKLGDKLRQRGVSEGKLKEIQALDPEKDLIFRLPEFLADDLNAEMATDKSPHRLALFFDTHEKFWGENQELTRENLLQQDAWFRKFLVNLEFNQGIVVVVAGRNQPRWHEASEDEIPTDFIDLQLVGDLTTADARNYLNLAGVRVSQPELVTAIVNYASVKPDQVHPFLLGLCVDVVESAEAKGVNFGAADFAEIAVTENKPKQLINRLLSYVDRYVEDAVKALSAARGFNYEVYQHLGKELNFSTIEQKFKLLTEFSFVQQNEDKGEGWYRLHDLLRRLDRETSIEQKSEAHQALVSYWQKQGNVAEVIYHTNQTDWEEGLKQWVEKFDEALKYSRYELCRALLEIRNDLTINSNWWLGEISYFEGKYYLKLSLYEAARRKFLKTVCAYDQALKIEPDSTKVLNNKGLALQNLGDLKAKQSQNNNAIQRFEEAISTFDKALDKDYYNIKILNSKGITLRHLGDLKTRLCQYDDAVINYKKAINAFKQALDKAPNNTALLNNKGDSLQNLGDLHTELSQHDNAFDNYREAIKTYEQALTQKTEDIRYLTNMGLSLQKLGYLHFKLDQHNDALTILKSAIFTFDKALTQSPNDIFTLNNKGLTLQSLGDFRAQLNQHKKAFTYYKKAITFYDKALDESPHYSEALNNKGFTLKQQGDLQAQLSEHDIAFTSYQKAIILYNQALTKAPNYGLALLNKGETFKNLGNLYAELSNPENAMKYWQLALGLVSRCLELAPKDSEAQTLRDQILEKIQNSN